MAQIQLGKVPYLDDADCMAPTRHRELDHTGTDQGSIYPERHNPGNMSLIVQPLWLPPSVDGLDDQVGIDHTDHLSELRMA